MSLPANLLDRLHTRLGVRYGAKWLSAYEGIDFALVRADWAHVLSGMENHLDAMAWALDNAHPTYPPTALEFRDLCRQAPRPQAPTLPAPKFDSDAARTALQAVKAATEAAPQPQGSPAQQAYARLRALEASGKPMTLAQREFMARLDLYDRGGQPPSVVMAGFQPIPPEVLPPGMREGITLQEIERANEQGATASA